jgi:hypothetical protein
LDSNRRQIDDRGLVEIFRLDGETDPAGQLATAFHEFLPGGLGRLLALQSRTALARRFPWS